MNLNLHQTVFFFLFRDETFVFEIFHKFAPVHRRMPSRHSNKKKRVQTLEKENCTNVLHSLLCLYNCVQVYLFIFRNYCISKICPFLAADIVAITDIDRIKCCSYLWGVIKNHGFLQIMLFGVDNLDFFILEHSTTNSYHRDSGNKWASSVFPTVVGIRGLLYFFLLLFTNAI